MMGCIPFSVQMSASQLGTAVCICSLSQLPKEAEV
jgi:hypothetical protein